MNLRTEYKPIFEDCGRKLLIDLLTNIIFPIRSLFSNIIILFCLNISLHCILKGKF